MAKYRTRKSLRSDQKKSRMDQVPRITIKTLHFKDRIVPEQKVFDYELKNLNKQEIFELNGRVEFISVCLLSTVSTRQFLGI
ncbi:hypothetical protein BpHYR1_019003 [Brachionus plicatilis]|uniref:Uncharacterized protein n=1 Tax=Brachionus plicatilis TaxID=10195 RepID=A0A3M7RRC6_BRAPC|nr:hypothetical protein BpHYR1_019003 [Brachionus plicatilis]